MLPQHILSTYLNASVSITEIQIQLTKISCRTYPKPVKVHGNTPTDLTRDCLAVLLISVAGTLHWHFHPGPAIGKGAFNQLLPLGVKIHCNDFFFPFFWFFFSPSRAGFMWASFLWYPGNGRRWDHLLPRAQLRGDWRRRPPRSFYGGSRNWYAVPFLFPCQAKHSQQLL